MGRYNQYGPDDLILARSIEGGRRRGMFLDPPDAGMISAFLEYRGDDALANVFETFSEYIEAAAVNLTEGQLRNNPRNRDYPYDPFRGNRKSYRRGFEVTTSRRIGRPGIRISNTAQTASWVEYGNEQRGGGWITASGTLMTLPLKKRIGSTLWQQAKATKNPKLRRVPFDVAYAHGVLADEHGEETGGFFPVLIFRRGDNYFILRRRVRPWGGYGILQEAVEIGVRSAEASIRAR